MKVLLILIISLMISTSVSCTSEPNINWEERYDMLYLEHLDVENQKDIARGEVVKLEQAVIDLKVVYSTKSLAYDNLVDDYKTALRFIDMAEYIIHEAGIEFVYVGPRRVEE